MSKFEKILSSWKEEMSVINQKSWMRRLATGDFTLKNYKGFLLETYHHAGINPQIQGFATMFLKNNPRKEVDMFFKHASSEVGHDLMALNDLIALGEDEKRILSTRPLPSTIAFNAFVLMQIQFQSAVSYLGYLFHLEFLPTQQGHRHMEEAARVGIPKNAMTFLEEHATVDVGHNKMMERYVENLIKTDQDLEDVIYAAKTSAHLHYHMLAHAFENGETFFT